MNILHLFSISIIISGSLYPVFALDTPQVCDANSLPHYGPHNPSHIYIKDTSGNLPYIPLTDHTAILHDDDVWNTHPEPRTIQVTLTIHNQDTGQLVFNQTQSLQMQACSGPESIKWRFVPIQVANYIATISDDRDKESMIFNSILDATKSQTVSSPLEQLRFGIDLHSIVCKQDLQLVIKSEDGSPACVKSESAQKLIQLGWAMKDKKSYHVYYPGLPPPIIDTRIAKVVSGTQEAQSIVGYYVGLPHYLPLGYSMQTILVDGSSKFVKILASNFPLTQDTTSVEFMEKGGIMIYMEPTTSEFNQTSWIAEWIKQTNGSSEIKISGYNGVINDITKGERFDEEIDLPAEIVVFPDNAIVEISAFLHPDELTKIAEGMLAK